jgi:hypothetical protein
VSSRTWRWDVIGGTWDEAMMEATVNAKEILYTVWTIGPAGGGGMAGGQWLEDFAENGPRVKMPKEVEAEIRAYVADLIASKNED